MIRVARSAVAVPALLGGKEAADEQTNASSHYGTRENRSKEFPFKVYRHRSVRDALEELFRMKCAYCETKVGIGDDADIEHWRPKGAVKEEDGTRSFPAYYWLASSWDNLLLACVKCNRPRKYRITGGEETVAVWRRSGKGMLFPLAEGDVRATERGGESSEHPLLVDPCKDDPAKYLEFVVLDDTDPDRKALLRPKGKRGLRLARGERTIDVYSLNRPLLVERRQTVLTELQVHLANFKDAMENFDAVPAGNPVRETSVQQMIRSAGVIKERLKPDAEYLMMSKEALKEFIRGNPAVRSPLEKALRG